MTMTGFCWRLLAVFVLIFVCACAFVRSQDSQRLPVMAPDRKASPYLWPVERVRPPLSPIPPGVGPATSGTPAFEQIARVAGIIFSGRVTSIGQSAGLPGRETASTTITFQVE